MSSPHSFIDLPAPRHPIRWVVVALSAVVLLVVTAPSAAAHAEHSPLPDGFEARISGVVDATDGAADPGAAFTMARDGAMVSVSYTGADELVIVGEQAAEPLVRIAGGVAAVNAASPQAVQVEGAQVDPAAAAELIDLVWDRIPPAWEPLPRGDSVAFMDHRAVPGHPPVRSDFADGDVAATWSIPFTVGATEYRLTGEVVAVTLPASGASAGVVVVGGVLLALVMAVFAWKGWRAIVARPEPAPAPVNDAAEKELISAG